MEVFQRTLIKHFCKYYPRQKKKKKFNKEQYNQQQAGYAHVLVFTCITFFVMPHITSLAVTANRRAETTKNWVNFNHIGFYYSLLLLKGHVGGFSCLDQTPIKCIYTCVFFQSFPKAYLKVFRLVSHSPCSYIAISVWYDNQIVMAWHMFDIVRKPTFFKTVVFWKLYTHLLDEAWHS